MLNLIMNLIGFNTTQNENAAMQYIEQYVKEQYRDVLIYEHQAIGDTDRYNLIIKNTDQPNIILAGHVDTVPEFSKEQFIPKIEGNKLYGR
jgi:acetylornithine deacetylase/succinyl-diaminopimelate desuccinylase-like protein